MKVRMVRLGSRLHAPAQNWPNWAPETTGGFAGVVTHANNTHVKAVMDSDRAVYTWPRHVANRYILESDRVIQVENGKDFKLVSTKTRGMTVKTIRPVKKWTFVGVYPGRVYSYDQHKKLMRQGLVNDMYTVDMFRMRYDRYESGYIIEDNVGVIDPSLGSGIDPLFQRAFPCRINEPPPSVPSNCVFVYNIVRERIEVWTDINLPKNAELYLCYGIDYPRTWTSACSIPSSIQSRAYIIKEGGRPIQKPGYVPVMIGKGPNKRIEWTTAPAAVESAANTGPKEVLKPTRQNNTRKNNNNTAAMNALLKLAGYELSRLQKRNSPNTPNNNNTAAQPVKRQRTKHVPMTHLLTKNITHHPNGRIEVGDQTIDPRNAHERTMMLWLKSLPPKVRKYLTLGFVYVPRNIGMRPRYVSKESIVNAVVESNPAGHAAAQALNIRLPPSGYRRVTHAPFLKHAIMSYINQGRVPNNYRDLRQKKTP